MAGPNFVLDKGYLAGGAITKYAAVKLSDYQTVLSQGTSGGACIGICQETTTSTDATNGRVVDIRILGITRMINGVAGALALGAKVMADTSGRAIVATSTNNVIGIVLTPGAAQGDQIDVLLTPGIVA
jgi:hypothetical protein